MNDPMMNKILKGFDEIGQQRIADNASTSGVSVSSDPMLAILKNFHAVSEDTINEAGQTGPGAKYKPYMPGTHKMGKNTDTKHPASNYLVGGEEGEPDEGDEVISEEPIDEETLGQKQSFSDIFRSLAEIEQDRLNDKEVQVKEKKRLQHNDKGTYDLSEIDSDSRMDQLKEVFRIKRELYAEIKYLTQLVRQSKDEALLQEVYESVLEAQYKLGNQE